MMTLSKVLGMWGAVCGLVLAGGLLAGCSASPKDSAFAEVPGLTGSAPAAAPETAPPPPSAAVGASNVETLPATPGQGSSPEEVLSSGDTVNIVFSDLPSPQPPFEGQVKGDGTITLFLNQTFTVAGKTRGQLEKEIRAAYVPKFFKYMTVTIKPKDATQFYYVGGEVRAPGRQVYIGKMTVTKAIQSCGDFTDFAKKSKVQLTRAGGKRTEVIDGVKALRDPNLDVEIYPGDKIHVPRRIW